LLTALTYYFEQNSNHELDEMNTKQLFDLVLSQASEHAILLLDPQGSIIEWSAGAARLFGHKREQILGKPFAAIFTAEDRELGIPDLEMAVAASDAISEDDRSHVRADDSRFWATGSLTALRAANGTLLGYAKILRDRTNLREQLELLEHQRDALAGEAHSKELVLATLSHELRNLLAGLLSGLRMLRSPASDEARREAVAGLMEEQIEILRRLTNDVLEAQRLKTGKVALALAPVDLRNVVRQVLDAVQPNLSENQLRLELLEPSAPIVVQGDAARLYQVLMNLIDNAMKYTPAGGRIWVKVTVEDPEGIIRIEDTGRGIPPDMLSRIFDLFTQVETGGSQRGLGIGLALVKELVTLHGGSVQARSEGQGKGSEFTVRLPLQPSSS